MNQKDVLILIIQQFDLPNLAKKFRVSKRWKTIS